MDVLKFGTVSKVHALFSLFSDTFVLNYDPKSFNLDLLPHNQSLKAGVSHIFLKQT